MQPHEIWFCGPAGLKFKVNKSKSQILIVEDFYHYYYYIFFYHLVSGRGGSTGWHVFYHFVGAVPGSTDMEVCLKRLLKELNQVNVSGNHNK